MRVHNLKKGGVELVFTWVRHSEGPYKENIEFRSSQDKLKSEAPVEKKMAEVRVHNPVKSVVEEFDFTSARALHFCNYGRQIRFNTQEGGLCLFDTFYLWMYNRYGTFNCY